MPERRFSFRSGGRRQWNRARTAPSPATSRSSPRASPPAGSSGESRPGASDASTGAPPPVDAPASTPPTSYLPLPPVSAIRPGSFSRNYQTLRACRAGRRLLIRRLPPSATVRSARLPCRRARSSRGHLLEMLGSQRRVDPGEKHDRQRQQPGLAAARPKSRSLPTVAHLAIRTRRSMPSWVCSRRVPSGRTDLLALGFGGRV